MATTVNTSEETSLKLRQALGSFTTGITVVTTLAADGTPKGFTANSFTSVSLSPPLLLVCLAKTSSNLELFSNCSSFAINILEEGQKDISGRFASSSKDRFAETHWHAGPSGAPILEGVVSWFDCSAHNLIDAGDHVVLIGKIEAFEKTDKRPLAYLRGRYLDIGLGETAAEAISHQGGVKVGCLLNYTGYVLLHQTKDGWSLPMGDLRPTLKEARLVLDKQLAKAGIPADIGFLYSVFDAPDRKATWLIFHGDLEDAVDCPEMKMFPIDQLPLDEIDIKPIHSILKRYQMESQDARFGLYVDESYTGGSITPIEQKSTHWEAFLRNRELNQ